MGTRVERSTPQSAGLRLQLAKVVGVAGVAASAVCFEYAASINFVNVQAVSLYPSIQGLVPLAMLITGLLVLPKTYLYAHWSRHLPRAGSTYVWISRSLGGAVGFITNFLWWIGLTGGLGFGAFADGTFLSNTLTAAGITGGKFFATPPGHIIVGLVVLWAIWGLHVSGVGNYSKFVVIIGGIILAAAATSVIVTLATPPKQFLALASRASHLHLAPPATVTPFSLHDFLAVMTLFVFSYAGISAATALGGEARQASTTMPRGIVGGWLVSLVLFTLVTAAAFHAAPWWLALSLIHGGKSAYATIPGIVSLISPGIGSALNLAVLVIAMKTAAPGLMAGSRLVFSWGQDHLLPNRFGRVSERHVPVAALTLTAAAASFFLIESAAFGWAIGVVIRSLTLLVVLLFVGVGLLNLKWNKRFADVSWARPIGAGSGPAAAAVLAIVISVVLLAAVVVVPKTPLVFQPLFQAVVGMLLGLWIYLAGRARAKRQGIALNEILGGPTAE